MGSRISSLFGRQNTENRNSRRENMDENHNEPEEEELDFTTVLALLLRNGEMRLVNRNGDPYIFDSEEEMASDNETGEAEHDAFVNDIPTMENLILKENDITQELLMNQGCTVTGYYKQHHPLNIAKQIKMRDINQCGINGKNSFTQGVCTSITSRFIPNHIEQRLKFREKLFCGIYSESGDMFMSACQDRKIRVYDTSHDRLSKPIKTINARDVGWSILDTAFSRDSRYVAYASWSKYVHLCSVFDGGDSRLATESAHAIDSSDQSFAIFSLKFSTDSKEVVCGANTGYMYIYNFERENSVQIDAHEDDINAVCFADDSSNILYSGGDDGLVKVWDRRCLSESNSEPIGIFAGHRDGITFIDSKGDARYLISNSKDQSIKLWDLRMFSSNSAMESVRQSVSQQSWDYRWQAVPRRMTKVAPNIEGDSSIETYRGHRVLSTLIRARFSPFFSTGSKYIYVGCSTGKLFVYDVLTGEIVSKRKNHKNCVRDVSWHPYDTRLITSSWDHTVALWNWNNDYA